MLLQESLAAWKAEGNVGVALRAAEVARRARDKKRVVSVRIIARRGFVAHGRAG